MHILAKNHRVSSKTREINLFYLCFRKEFAIAFTDIPSVSFRNTRFPGQKTAQQAQFLQKVRTTRITGGLLWPYKGLVLAAPQGAVKRSADRIQNSSGPTKWGCFYLLLFTGSPVNGSMYSFSDIWSAILSSANWFRIYSAITFLFLPTVST